MDFLKWYRTKVESNDLDPPDVIWDNIQDELDLNQSWQLINKHLDRKAVIRRNRIWAAAAGILVLISLSSLWFLNDNVKDLEIQDTTNQQFISDNQEVLPAQKLREKEMQATNPEVQIYKSTKEALMVEDNSLLLADVKQNESLRTRKQLLAKLSSAKIDYKYTNDTLRLASAYGILTNNLIEQEERTAFKKFYIGTSGQLANTWLLNEKTYSGMESSSLISADASFGSNFGVFVGTNILKQVDLQMDVNLFVQNNQNYSEYLNGHYVENKMKFNYSQLAISFRYYFSSQKIMQGEHGINFGGYLGHLNSAYQIIDGDRTNLTSNYNNYDYGLFLSYEYVIPLTHNLGLGTGFRAYYGLQNIYAGNEFIPSYLNKTQNASINVGVSLKYRIK